MKKEISDAEWKIMNIIWETPALTIKEINERVGDTGWSYTTVRTLVGRLTEKGVIAVDKTNPTSFRYSAAISEGETKRGQIDMLVKKVFRGSKSMFAMSLTEDSGLTEKEQEELKRLIEKISD